MNKGLEALRNINREKPTFFSAIYDGDMWEEDIEIIENELISLETAKEILRILRKHATLTIKDEDDDCPLNPYVFSGIDFDELEENELEKVAKWLEEKK